MILAEVGRRDAGIFAAELAPDGNHLSWPELSTDQREPHGVMIISRIGELTGLTAPAQAPREEDRVAHADLVTWLREEPHDPPFDAPRRLRDERWIAARIDMPSGPVLLSGFHAPYAADSDPRVKVQNQLTKRMAYRQVTAWARAREADGHRVVLGMDGNNWGDRLPGERRQPSRGRRRRNPILRLIDQEDLFGDERAFHDADPPHGLVDALHAGELIDAHGSQAAIEAIKRERAEGGHSQPESALALTYRRKADGDRMDRIYVSPSVNVRAAGVCHGALEPEQVSALRKGQHLCCGSDHALAWADVDL